MVELLIAALPFCDEVKLGNVPEVRVEVRDQRIFIVNTGKRDPRYVDACQVRGTPAEPPQPLSERLHGDPFWATRSSFGRNFLW